MPQDEMRFSWYSDFVDLSTFSKQNTENIINPWSASLILIYNSNFIINPLPVNPLTAGAAYIRFFHFLLAYQVPHFK